MAYGTLKCDNITFTNGGIDQTVTVSGIVQSISGNITATGTIQGATIIGTSTVSGATVSGNVGVFTAITGGTAGFTTVTGTTVTGTTANFATLSGATITGGHVTTASGTYTGNVTAAAFIPTGSTVPTNGVYLPAANSVALATNGTGRVFVDSDGTIRINTTVTATSVGGLGIEVTSGGNTTAPLTMLNRGTTNDSGVGLTFRGLSAASAETDYGYFRMVASDTTSRHGRIELWTTNSGTPTEKLRITHDGKVGVGTSAPTSALHVSGESGVAITLDGANNYSSTASLLLNQGRSEIRTTINASGGNPGGSLLFRTRNNSGSLVDAVTINSSQQVGIGVASPVGPLDVVTGAASRLLFRDLGVGARIDSVNLGNSAYDDLVVNGDPLIFQTVGNERARIDSSGRLLVGTSTSNASFNSRIQIAGSSFESASQSISRFEASASGPGLYLVKSRNATIGSNTVVQNGDALGSVQFYGADGNGYSCGASIDALVDGTPGAGDLPTRLVFSTTADGASSPTERMRISQNGTVLIGTTTAYSGNGITFSVAGSSAIRNTTTGTEAALSVTTSPYDPAFVVRGNGGIANYSANNVNLSDRNSKKDITPAAGTWDCLKEWEIVNFRYKNQPDDADLNMGVIAQQVAESCPEVITVFQEATEDQPEKLGVKDQQMIWMAIKALQEAQLRIETLEAEVAAIKGA